MAIFRSIYLAALLGLANLSSAYPSELNGPNYETYTNSLGYEAVRFKPGMEPGSADFVRRFSRNAGLTTSPAEGALAKRQDNRVTFPSVGRNRIPYGCQTDIGNAVLSKLFEVCDDIACDTGSPVTVPVTFPDNGREEDAEVTFVARGTYPSGMKDLLIKAIQAEVIFDAVEIEDVRSDTPGIGAHKLPSTFICPVVHASNFLSVVVRDEASEALVATMTVEASFKEPEGDMCGTAATVAKEVAGAINAFGGALMGIIQELTCSG